MTNKLYNYGLEVFNGEEEKYKRFLERNKEKTAKTNKNEI